MRRALVAMLALFLAVPVTASADVTRQDLEDAQQRIKDVSVELEDQLGRLDAALVQRTLIEDRIAAVEAQIAEQERQLALADIEARSRVDVRYMAATAQPFGGILGADEFADVPARNAYRDALTAQDDENFNQLEFLRRDQERLILELAGLKAQQGEIVEEFEAASQAVMGQLENANGSYQTLYDTFQREEAERRRIEEERRQAAAAAAAAAAAQSASSSSGGGGSSAPIVSTTRGKACPIAGAHSFRDGWGEPRPGGRTHKGLDMIAATGTPLVAAEAGTIWSPNWHHAGGRGLYIRGNSGDIWYYAHMNGYASGIRHGTNVKAGQLVGWVGATGNASVPHLHLGWQPGGGSLRNPYSLMVSLCR